jgi:hypothetical protein
VSQKPAEIIVTQGPAALRAVAGTGLQRVTNTPNVLFFHPAENLYDVLLSGRWFAARAFAGPWQFATDRLPPDFALIAPQGPDGAVLASVPGTIAAQEAILAAQIPRTATLKRSAARITVVYSGTPHFVPVAGTPLLYAVNTTRPFRDIRPHCTQEPPRMTTMIIGVDLADATFELAIANVPSQ